ncbi:MAG: hypothetical protein R3B70_35095 [Polyangiaceae bacterium]
MDVATWSYRVAIVLGILGFFVRSGALVAAVSHIFLWSLQFSFGYSVHNHVVPMILLALALSPVASPTIVQYFRARSAGTPLAEVGSYPAYVVESVRFALVAVYVQAGLEKLVHSGLRYFNGVTLQTHFLWGLERITPAANWPLWFLGAAAVVTVAWECSFGFAHYHPRARLYLTVSALIFHEIVRRGMSIDPFGFLEAGVLFFIPPAELPLLWKGKGAPRTTPDSPPPLRRPLLAGVLVLCLLQWAPFFVRRGVYPFLSFSLFSGSYSGGEIQPRMAKIHYRVSPTSPWVQVDETKTLAMHTIAFSEFLTSRYASFYFEHLSLPHYAQRFAHEDHREEHCQWLLSQVRQHLTDQATSLSVTLDYYVVGNTEQHRVSLYECNLPAP